MPHRRDVQETAGGGKIPFHKSHWLWPGCPSAGTKHSALFSENMGRSYLCWYCVPLSPTPPTHFTTMVKLSQKKKKKISTHNGATSIPHQFLLLSSMVYLFLLVCFSLNPSITLQCKMAKLLAHATSIMYLSSLITLAENAWTAFASAVGWEGVNKYYLVGFFFSLRSTAFLDCFYSWIGNID